MSNQPPLLPSDYYLMRTLAEAGVDITEDEWRDFKAEVKRRALDGPQPAVVCGAETLAIIAIVAQVISIGITIVASFFKPKPTRPARLKADDSGGKALNSQGRFAPTSGFDAVQEPAAIGTTIPVVYALREPFNGQTYGGVRINLPLLWSQIESFGGHQMLRAIFLLSEGNIDSIEPGNFAIGNNAIGGYDFLGNAANQLGSRLTIYFRPNGGRISPGDRVFGRSAANDAGNAASQGGPDVFAVRQGGAWTQNFCSASKPTTQTTFGLYTLIGNNFAYRVNPTFRPTVNAQLVPKGDNGNSKVVCDIDQTAAAQRLKYSATFSTRSGLVSGNVNNVGSTIIYRLDRSSDSDTKFKTITQIESWNQSVELYEADFVELQTDIGTYDAATATRITNWVVIEAVNYDQNNKRLEVIIRFRADAAVNFLSSRITRDGNYKIRYGIKLLNVGNTKEEIEDNFTVTVSRTTKTKITQSGSNTQPTLTEISPGVYVLNPGTSATYSQTEDPATFVIKPLTKTLSIKYLSDKEGKETAKDAAATIAGRQKTWDDALVVGELYKVGSALCVCTDRTPANAVFESEADFFPVGGGTTIEATLRTIRPGTVTTHNVANLQVAANVENPRQRFTATNAPHVYRVAIGSVTTSRPCRAVEIGIRSALGIRLGNICNFNGSKTYDEINADACLSYEGEGVKKGTTLKVNIYQSNTLSTNEQRYSFFRISFREAGTGGGFTELPFCFGVRSATQQNVFNAIRLRMPDIAQWEFRFEPLSGWEIRNNIATGSLQVLDAKMRNSEQVLNAAGVNIQFHGLQVPRRRETFTIAALRRTQNYDEVNPEGTGDIGIGFTDESSYADSWGRLAEAFPYEEIQSSAANGPEHEIVYVNEILPNPTTPLYDNLAIVGLNIRSSAEFSQFSQFSAYVTGGIRCRRLLRSNTVGPTHLFPDILWDLMTDRRYGRGDIITDELIDVASFREAAQWCQNRGYFYDGSITNKLNVRQWAADVAATHLLIFGEADGRFFLRPALSFDPVPIRALFTAGNIKEGSFTLQYLETEDRQPIQVSVKYREERVSSSLTNPGLFPTEREILVREANVPDTAPIESVDMSDYCTNPQHAIDAAKYIAKFRRLSTHGVRFETTYEGVVAGLSPGDYIRVALDYNVYDEFNNGVVTPSGALVSTQPLANGSYPIIRWNGDNNQTVTEGTLTVSNNGQTATPAGIVFTVNRAATRVQTYQIESLEPTGDGYLAVEAVHMPTTADGRLRMSNGFDPAGNWIIQR